MSFIVSALVLSLSNVRVHMELESKGRKMEPNRAVLTSHVTSVASLLFQL